MVPADLLSAQREDEIAVADVEPEGDEAGLEEPPHAANAALKATATTAATERVSATRDMTLLGEELGKANLSAT